MYAGHLAVALVLKAKNPKVPAVPVMMGVGLLEVLIGIMI